MIYVSTKSRRKPQNTKKKQELNASWEELKRKWDNESLSGKSVRGDRKGVSVDSGRGSTPDYRRTVFDDAVSVDLGVGVAAKKDSPEYTGENMIGIGQLHKSNAVPIFKQEDAEDIARMRR